MKPLSFMSRAIVVLGVISTMFVPIFAQEVSQINLPSSKALQSPVPGMPQAAGSFPVTIALSPDGLYAAVLDDGYGRREYQMHQGIGILNLSTNEFKYFPDARLRQKSRQTYFLGLSFSADGRRLYASVASLTDPLAKERGSTGNGIAVYRFENGEVTPERFIAIVPQSLGGGKRAAKAMSHAPQGTAVPYPAGLAVVGGKDGERLLVADNLSDDVLLLDAASGRVLRRFDLSTAAAVPASFPYAVVVNREGTRAWCSLWNASQIAELNLNSGKVARWINLRGPKNRGEAGSHPTALLLSGDQRSLFVTLSNRDEVAVVNTPDGKVLEYLSTLLPRQKFPGTYPNGLAQTADGKRLFVANASSDAVAVFAKEDHAGGKAKSGYKLKGFIPTEWYPTAVAVRGGDLLIVSGKSQGTGPNSALLPEGERGGRSPHPYIATLLQGSIARVNIASAEKNLEALTRQVEDSNRMNGRVEAIPFSREACAKPGKNAECNPIRHVIYVIKENRTYDQVFGDLDVGDGDPSLVMYGEQITPNQHALARQFGVVDNFYDSGDVSGNGHVWSTAAIDSDYTEKTWPISYRNSQRTYDYEGWVMDESPLEQGIADVNEPGSGYLWSNAARNKISYRHYGEFVSTFWCDDVENKNPQVSGTPLPPGQQCSRKFVRKGEPLPNYVGDPKGGPSPWPWPVPVIARNQAMKRELRGHFDPRYADFRLDYPDQFRADEFLNEFRDFVSQRNAGKDTMPALIVLRLPNDHTSGTRPGMASPAASVADNDLAVGRVVDAISHSAYWDDTAIFILEDDAQDGADHVDAHRSIALVISKYAPRKESPVVHHEFYTTVNVIHTMETLLGLPPMNNNDALAPVMSTLFSGKGDQPAFTADYRNRDNGLLYQVNPPKAAGAAASMKMDFRHADSVDTQALNRILWHEAKGDVPMPEPKHTVIPVK